MTTDETLKGTNKNIGVTSIFVQNRDSKARILVNVGGSGSSKSHSIAQLIIEKFLTETGKQFVVARKTMPALRRSSYTVIIDLLKQYGIYEYVSHNKTDCVLTYRNNTMCFFGLDEPSKAKSLAGGASYIWLEEADEFSYDDFLAFNLQLRRPTENEINQIFLSFNPIDGNGWIPTKLIGQEGVEVIHSTIDNNPFADPAYVKALKTKVEGDENYYRVFVLGEWGKLENLVFPNYILVDNLPTTYKAWCYGLDFGFVHPTALIQVMVAEDNLYWHECLCESNLTNADLIERLSHFEKGNIYADYAEPQRILEISRAGFAIFPANKDIQLGIDVCRRHPIHITKSSINIIKQIRGYSRKKDKDGLVLEQPLQVRNDTIDAGRYGTLGLNERLGFATARPRPTEPIRALTFKGRNKSIRNLLHIR